MRTMKDSGTVWLGQIPDSWRISKISDLYELRTTKVSDRDYPPLSVTMKGIVPQLESAAKTNAHDDRKLVRKGDFAINSRSDRRGSCGISDYDGSVSLINTVMKPRDTMNPNYYDWLFHTTQFADEFYKWGHGIVDDLWTTNWQDMKHIDIPVPSLEEQEIIAAFLDEKCAEIDTLHSEIEKQVETLEEYKKSVIAKTVTKGLNPEAEMKESELEGVDTIPVNWTVKRVKYFAKSIYKGNGITRDDVKEDGDIQCVRYGEIYSTYNRDFSNCFSRTDINRISSPQYIQKGDILCAGTGELIEEIGKNVVYMGDDPCIAGGDIIIVKHNQNPLFFNYALNSIYAQNQKSKGKAKLKVVHISATNIGDIMIAMPPLDEQEKIATVLNEKCMTIEESIIDKKKQMGILAEYKKSIIYEYVTGKKEVPADVR